MASSSTQAPSGTQLLLAKDLLGRATVDDFVGWARSAQALGHATPAVERLAALVPQEAPPLEEVQTRFHSALEELGLSVPPDKQLLHAYVAALAGEILAGRVGPRAGAERIHAEVLVPMGHPQELMPWCYVCEGLDPATLGELEGPALEMAIFQLARGFSAGPDSEEQSA